MNSLPPTLHRYRLTGEVLHTTREYLREPGKEGLEAVVLWLGRVIDQHTADVLAAIRPYQIAYRSEQGLAVELPQDALSELIGALPEGIFVLARVHSHPAEAYHSDLDDTNMVIAHQGAISIVVPDFAARQIELTECSINELRHGEGWVALDRTAIQDRFEVS